MILVTGGAGFIGANFILDWLRESDESVINLDKLTYAGNLENFLELAGDPRYAFVHGDIGNKALVEGLLLKHRPRAIINLPPRAMSIVRFTALVSSSRPISLAPSSCLKACAYFSQR